MAKRKRPKRMLDILQLPMPKETLAKMTPEERSVFLLLGYACNQVNLLWKPVIIATNHRGLFRVTSCALQRADISGG
jgi:hypothetical protein